MTLKVPLEGLEQVIQRTVDVRGESNGEFLAVRGRCHPAYLVSNHEGSALKSANFEPKERRNRLGVAGRTTYNGAKFKELVLYLSQESAGDEGFGMVKLNKLLYRSDFEAFRLLGRSITGATYERQDYGPVARELPIALDELAARGYISWLRVPAGPHVRKVPDPHEAADLSQFADEELSIIRKALQELAEYGGKGVSEWSHEESAGWRLNENGEEITYESGLIDTSPLDERRAGLLRGYVGSLSL